MTFSTTADAARFDDFSNHIGASTNLADWLKRHIQQNIADAKARVEAIYNARQMEWGRYNDWLETSEKIRKHRDVTVEQFLKLEKILRGDIRYARDDVRKELKRERRSLIASYRAETAGLRFYNVLGFAKAGLLLGGRIVQHYFDNPLYLRVKERKKLRKEQLIYAGKEHLEWEKATKPEYMRVNRERYKAMPK
jgi:hypothetical protein